MDIDSENMESKEGEWMIGIAVVGVGFGLKLSLSWIDLTMGGGRERERAWKLGINRQVNNINALAIAAAIMNDSVVWPTTLLSCQTKYFQVLGEFAKP